MIPGPVLVGIALVVAIFAGRAYYKSISRNGTKEQRFIERAKKKGCVTTGTCVNVERFAPTDRSGDRVRERNYRVWATYAYEISGVTYKKKMCFMDEGSLFPKYPHSVKVYYDPKNPKKAVCPEEATKLAQSQTGCMGSLCVGTVVLLAVFYLLNFLFG